MTALMQADAADRIFRHARSCQEAITGTVSEILPQAVPDAAVETATLITERG